MEVEVEVAKSVQNCKVESNVISIRQGRMLALRVVLICNSDIIIMLLLLRL